MCYEWRYKHAIYKNTHYAITRDYRTLHGAAPGMSAADQMPHRGDIPYHGPPELERQWCAFVAGYVGAGDATLRLRGAALLDQLAFGEENPAELAAEMTTPSGERRSVRHSIEQAALALSECSAFPEWRPLHRAVVAALADRWTELRRREGLYPPPPISPGSGVTIPEREERQQQYAELLHSPEGALLAGTLTLLHDRLIRAIVWRMCKYVDRTDPESREALFSDALNQMPYVLRAYDASCGSSLTTSLHNYLRANLLRLVSRGRHAKPWTTDTGYSKGIADPRDLRPYIALEAKDSADHVRRLLPRVPERERQVLLMRFGFLDGHQYTLEEIAAEQGCTRQRVQQVERSGLRYLDALLNGEHVVAPRDGRER